MEHENAQDAIISALNHPERRQILHIIHRTSGIRYSAILGETGLTTSKLNYQLNELKGLIEKTQEGEYNLTELGKRAISIMENIEENLKGDLELTPIIENSRRKHINHQMNVLFGLIIASTFIGAIVLTYFYFVESDISTNILLLSYGFCALLIYGFNEARKSSPKYMNSFVDWLDWTLFGGDTRFVGRKMLVVTVLGLIIGILLGHAGTGLIAGLIIGSAIEYTG